MAGHGGSRGGGAKAHRYTGLRWREVRNGAEALAAAIVLQARREWLDGGDKAEVAAFLTSEWCAYLCDEAGIVHAELLRQTLDAPTCAFPEPGVDCRGMSVRVECTEHDKA